MDNVVLLSLAEGNRAADQEPGDRGDSDGQPAAGHGGVHHSPTRFTSAPGAYQPSLRPDRCRARSMCRFSIAMPNRSVGTTLAALFALQLWASGETHWVPATSAAAGSR